MGVAWVERVGGGRALPRHDAFDGERRNVGGVDVEEVPVAAGGVLQVVAVQLGSATDRGDVTDVLGDDAVSGLLLRDTVDGSTRELPVTGVFVAIGNDPRTHLVHEKLDLTPEGTIWVDGRSSRTSVPGVFAAGDVIDPTYRQAITAAGTGTIAALDAEHFLADLEDQSVEVPAAEAAEVITA